MWFPTTDAVNFLNTALNLPASGKEQDWEIELADYNRIEEFICFFNESDLPNDCSEALVALILASFDDAIWGLQFDEEVWRKFSLIIFPNIEKFRDVLAGWASNFDNDEYRISKHVKKLLDPDLK